MLYICSKLYNSMEKLYQKFFEKIARIQVQSVRDFIYKIDWSNRMIGIKGSRGVGKTTIILQHIKTSYEINNKVLYVSLDDLYFTENKVYDLASSFCKQGGVLLAIDEVHKYATWAIELKNIYDDFPDLKIIFTGSSLLHLVQAKADLSRRAVVYSMHGLSFREFVSFETNLTIPALTLQQLMENHVDIAMKILATVKPLAWFKSYLNYGYYPYYMENVDSFHQKLSETLLTVLEVDIPQFAGIQTSNIIYLKKLLKIISVSVPFQPNMNVLSSRTGISLNTMKNYLYYLNEAQVLFALYTQEFGVNSLGKPEKIYLDNTNLMFNQGEDNVNAGNVRETFFVNQLKNVYEIKTSKHADFIIENKYTFEIGSIKKSKKQIANIENAFIVKDDIEVGYSNIIPLWLFGFLY